MRTGSPLLPVGNALLVIALGQFAGMTPATHGDRQQRFDHPWELLDGLRQRLTAGVGNP